MMETGAYRAKILLGVGGLIVLLIGIGFGLTTVYPLRYEREITAAATVHRLDPYLVFGVVRAESRFRPYIVSRAGAIGLMQITPDTGRWIATKLGVTVFTPAELYNPTTNIRFGTWYLRYLIDRFGGDVDAALLAYNAGPRAADRWRAGGEPVYPETAAYLTAVHRNRVLYRLLYGSFIGPVLRMFTG